MAYYERTDERDALILCNICNVNVSERSLLTHKNKCFERYIGKSNNGRHFKRCQYDSGHIVEVDKYSLHLEFCKKYQTERVSEHQIAAREVAMALNKASDEITSDHLREPLTSSSLPTDGIEDDWNLEANHETFTLKMSKLNIGTK